MMLAVAQRISGAGGGHIVIRLHNPSPHVAFFERGEITSTPNGDEILAIEYDDYYITVFPGETVEIRGVVPTTAETARWVGVSGYNSAPVVVPIN
jgi:exo-1,4-beta-D-glucosaminidase